MAAHIRLATPADAPAIADIHVRSWQHAYRGIVPDSVLDTLSIPAYEQLWRHTIELPPSQRRVWVTLDTECIGFCETLVSDDEDATPETAQVGSLYLQPARIATGVGRPLFEHAVDDLRHRQFRSVTLWVFRDNTRARRFYEVAGWHLDSERTRPRGDREVAEVRYRRDLAAG